MMSDDHSRDGHPDERPDEEPEEGGGQTGGGGGGVVCYAAGTRLLTPGGERAIETLRPGDAVLALADPASPEGGRVARPVRWIGRRRIDLTTHPRPETAAPVRIRCGAVAENVPHADLLVSPDHAVLADGLLICARRLVNGATVVRESDRPFVEYFHVELDAHALLLAEGLAAESYLDTGNRGFFARPGHPVALHPGPVDETAQSARERASCAPFASDEARVRPVWERLAARAAALGRPVPAPDATTDPEPRLLADGRTLRPVRVEGGVHAFVLPRGGGEARLVSRSGSPTDARPWVEDRRRLGVYVERLVTRDSGGTREIALDDPALSDGWWGVERNDVAPRRWTDGSASVPLPASEGPFLLEVHLGVGAMTYAGDTAEGERRAA